MITREEALELLNQKISNPNTRKHSIASEAVLRALAERLGEDPNIWGLCGLLHDIDLEEVENDMHRHAKIGAGWLEERGFSAEATHAVLSHNAEGTGVERESKLDFALTCGEQITGLIVATALVYPSKKLADVKVKSITKRMGEKRFAAGVSRERVMDCEKLGLSLEEFVEISLKAMQGVADEMGL